VLRVLAQWHNVICWCTVSVTNCDVPDSDSGNWHIIYSAACSSAEAQRDMLMYCFYWPPFTRMEITSE